MSFDRQAARALFNNPESRTSANPDRTQRRTLQSSPETTRAQASAVNPGIDEHGDLYARLSRPPKRGKAGIVLPIIVAAGLLAGLAVLVLAKTGAPVDAARIAAPSAAIAPAKPQPVARAPVTPTPVAQVAVAQTPIVATAPVQSMARIRPAPPTVRAPAPRVSTPRASKPEPAPVNPPATATAPAAPAPIILPPPLPTPEPTAPQ